MRLGTALAYGQLPRPVIDGEFQVSALLLAITSWADDKEKDEDRLKNAGERRPRSKIYAEQYGLHFLIDGGISSKLL